MVEQETGCAGKYLFRRVVGKETLELLGQMPSPELFVPSNGGYDSPGQEVVGLLPLSCCGLADCRAHGRSEGKVEAGRGPTLGSGSSGRRWEAADRVPGEVTAAHV